ncbi:MAG: hypothetical protein ACPLRU_01410 [Desulfofundulus sp.]
MDEIVILTASSRENLAAALELAHTHPLVVFWDTRPSPLARVQDILEESEGKIKGRVYFYQHG